MGRARPSEGALPEEPQNLRRRLELAPSAGASKLDDGAGRLRHERGRQRTQRHDLCARRGDEHRDRDHHARRCRESRGVTLFNPRACPAQPGRPARESAARAPPHHPNANNASRARRGALKKLVSAADLGAASREVRSKEMKMSQAVEQKLSEMVMNTMRNRRAYGSAPIRRGGPGGLCRPRRCPAKWLMAGALVIVLLIYGYTRETLVATSVFTALYGWR